MFVFEKYNLKSDYMYFLPTNFNYNQNDAEYSFTFFAIFGVVLIIIIAVFFFRDTLSFAKENTKHKVREFLKPIFFRVNGDTVHSVKEGPLQFVWEYLDTYFLQPSEPSTLYDYIGDEEDEGDDDDDDEEEEEDDDDNDGKEGMEEYAEEDDEED
jgi:hypothetical protein